MKKKSLLLFAVICALLMFCSASVLAADYDMPEKADVSPFAVAPSAVTEFSDVSAWSWYYEYIHFVTANGIFKGFPEGLFKPDDQMTRAQVARVIYALEGEPEITGNNSFKDISLNQWYYDAVEWAAAAGVVTGYPGGTFKPADPISRQDFVTMLYRYANENGYDVSNLAELDFPDKDSVDDYALNAFQWAISAGIINGIPANNTNYLKPKDFTTRAQVAKMLTVFGFCNMDLGKITDIQFDSANYTVAADSVIMISPVVIPETGYPVMTWTSSDESVAKVDRGIVKGIKPGTVTITVTAFDGKTAECTVTVKESAYDAVCNLVLTQGELNKEDSCYYYLKEWVDASYSYIIWGIGYDPVEDELFVIRYIEDQDQEHIHQVEMDMPRSALYYDVYFTYWDGLTYDGTARIFAPTYKNGDHVPFTSFYCEKPKYATADTKAFLNNEVFDSDVYGLIHRFAWEFWQWFDDFVISDFGFFQIEM